MVLSLLLWKVCTATILFCFYFIEVNFKFAKGFNRLFFVDTFENSDSDSDYQPNSDISSSDEENILFEDIEESDEENDFVPAREFCEIDPDYPTPAPPRFPFTSTPRAEISDDGVIGYFQLFFSDLLIQNIAKETNRYAEQIIGNSTARRNSRFKNWTATSASEISVYLAIIIIQGIVKKPNLEWYWTKRQSVGTPFFANVMSYARFTLLKKFFHFEEMECTEDCPNRKLQKIWPIYCHLNRRFAEMLTPQRDISIDESLLLYKGRLSWRQYIPSKRARFGIKSYLLCESNSGYIWKSIIYTGKDTILLDEYNNLPVSSQIVMTLIKDLLGKGYCLTTDNFYTSPQLADLLVTHKTDTYGTLRLGRKEVPANLKTTKLDKGGIIGYQRGKVCIFKWKDKKDVAVLSTIHNLEMQELVKRNNIVKKPQAILDYNHTMGGVDRADQHLTDYPVARKRGKKFYMKIFLHLLDQSIWNSYVLYKKSGGSKTHAQFRLDLAEELIEQNKLEAVSTSAKKTRPGKLPNPLRLTDRHFPDFVPSTENKENAARRCAVCCSKKDDRGKKVRKETRYYCKECNVGLCAVPCFKIYHTQKNF